MKLRMFEMLFLMNCVRYKLRCRVKLINLNARVKRFYAKRALK